MHVRIVLFLAFIFILTIPMMSVKADEPTWLFTVPKAKTLEEGTYNLGLLYADFGISENLELGIHGLKYHLPDNNLSLGASIFPMATAYVVTSLDAGSGELHVGLKAAPYVFFAGFEMPISDSLKFVVELNNGVIGGVRIFPAQNWTLDVFMGFVNFETYRYNRYGRVEIDEFNPFPGILFAYSGRL
ncbi:hypothetical protein ACFL6S_20450 [Candidatus Poribacteria bacterium]